MSCIAGGFALGGREAPPRDLIDPMLAAMVERAPDGTDWFRVASVSCGFAYLRTGPSGAEAQPRFTLDFRCWLAADARIDGRAELIRKLGAAGRHVEDDAPHAELILHAYAIFGDAFLEHLIGDFAFALWDGTRERLLLARDPFGVRPLYWARTDSHVWFASDIDAMLEAPGVSRALDDKSVADFLLIGMCREADGTIYRDIRCVEPGTLVMLDAAGPSVRRYWSMPPPVEVRYPKSADYVARFSELFAQAVRDRLPSGNVSLQLSGGMDSTSIAAEAVAACGPGRTMAYHVSASSFDPKDDETPLAQAVASRLGIDLVIRDVSEYALFEGHDRPELRTAYPLPYPHFAMTQRISSHMASRGSRVVLSGYGGDAVMTPDMDYYKRLLRGGRAVKCALEALRYVAFKRSVRGLGLGALLGRRDALEWLPQMPDWLDPQALRIDLRARWNAWWAASESARSGLEQLSCAWVQRQCEAMEILRFPLVARYPYLDIRLVKFLSGVPNYLVQDKWLLREAMRGRLPDEVRLRPKNAAPGDHVRSMVTNGKLASVGSPESAAAVPGVNLPRYLRAWANYCSGAGIESTWGSYLLLQPIAFGIWQTRIGDVHE